MNTIDEEQLAIERGRARFEADVMQTVRVIAERYRVNGDTLTGDAARAIFEEAFADVGLASRWSADSVAAFARRVEIPTGTTPLAGNDVEGSSPLLRTLFAVFCAPAHVEA